MSRDVNDVVKYGRVRPDFAVPEPRSHALLTLQYVFEKVLIFTKRNYGKWFLREEYKKKLKKTTVAFSIARNIFGRKRFAIDWSERLKCLLKCLKCHVYVATKINYYS